MGHLSPGCPHRAIGLRFHARCHDWTDSFAAIAAEAKRLPRLHGDARLELLYYIDVVLRMSRANSRERHQTRANYLITATIMAASRLFAPSSHSDIAEAPAASERGQQTAGTNGSSIGISWDYGTDAGAAAGRLLCNWSR